MVENEIPWWGTTPHPQHLRTQHPAMTVRIKPGQSLLGDSRIRLKQIYDAFNSDENLQTCRIKLGVDLSNGVLLDIYCFVHAHVKELGASSVTNRLADILHYLGHSPPRDAKIAF